MTRPTEEVNHYLWKRIRRLERQDAQESTVRDDAAQHRPGTTEDLPLRLRQSGEAAI